MAKRDARIPDRGFCIASVLGSGTGYDACFAGTGAKDRARKAARKLAVKTHERVELIQVQNRGRDRFIAGWIYPRRKAQK